MNHRLGITCLLVLSILLMGYIYADYSRNLVDNGAGYFGKTTSRNSTELPNATFSYDMERKNKEAEFVNRQTEVSLSQKGSTTMTSPVWARGLDIPSQYEPLYKQVNTYVEKYGQFPWKLVDNKTLFRGINILEYVEKFAIRGVSTFKFVIVHIAGHTFDSIKLTEALLLV